MNRTTLKTWAPWVLLVSAALVLGIATGASSEEDSPVASVENPGPGGAKVVRTWLEERGAVLERLTESVTALPSGVEALVIAAPTERTVSEEEVATLEQFVTGGGTLIYLSPRPTQTQPELAKWLGLSDGPAPGSALEQTQLGDLGGASVDVALPRGLLEGVHQLRVSADSTLKVDSHDAVPVAGNALWYRAIGKGAVWIGAGSDLIENRRLDLLDNAQLWANLSRHRIAFDEFHLSAAPAPAWSLNLQATLAQLLFVALLFVAVRGRRLGPPRATLRREHRSSLEYVHSMAGLMRRAGVERQLRGVLRDRLRRLMQERLGIALALPIPEASRVLAGHTGLGVDAWARLDAALAAEEADFTAVAAEAARLEDAVVGRHAA